MDIETDLTDLELYNRQRNRWVQEHGTLDGFDEQFVVIETLEGDEGGQ